MARTPGTPASKIERMPVYTPNSKIERMPVYTPGGSRVKEEKIFVTVRVRPLNDSKEEAVWECTNSQTIQHRNDSTASYTFDRVFGPTSLTETVYEEGAKVTALSALTGINATIFAYGQTGSGKTFTMQGVTERAVSDIYNHIRNTPEREFTIKMSAMEIYNENVKDLLMPDSGPLRLLDDPEKGTIVEKLEEQTARDIHHLSELISKCEAQRQVGETGSNKRSSRSHQIIRLTVESRLREHSGCVKSFVAVLNFVDLAGSERVAQTHAKGKTLEEGCHINKSLLTLTTVIRKLSENKSAHIPYRDSKLTRILQLSLGGNARTAIICTMSPSKSNMELSRNTLFFAMSAKKVTNTAQVNMVISDKQLVKHLQKEVARLEAELRTPEATNSDAILIEKDRRIKQMEEEMEELKKERDTVKFQLNELCKKIGCENQQGRNPIDSSPRRIAKCLTFSFAGPSRQNTNPLRQSSTAPVMLVQEIRKLEHLQQQLGDEANRALEVLQKEVACHRLGNQDAAETIAKLQAEIRDMRSVKPSAENKEMPSSETGPGCQTNLKEEITRLQQGNTIANLEAQLENVQLSIDRLVMSLPNIAGQMGQCNGSNMEKTAVTTKNQSGKKKKTLPLALSSTMNRPNLLRAPCSPLSSSRNAVVEADENQAPQLEAESNTNTNTTNSNTPTKSESTPTKSESNATTPAMSGGDASSREGTPGSGYRRSSSVNMRKMQKMFQNAAEENVRSIRAYVTELKERVAKLQYQKQLLVCQVLELESNEAANGEDNGTQNISAIQSSPNSWRNTFREQMQQIFMLWHECYVSIIHRTQFYLLFQGDQADQIYVEVELRRLMWLHQHFSEGGGDASPAQMCGDDPTMSISSSIRELKNEREFLAKRMNSRLTEDERERLFLKWDVPLDGKQRKLQLVNKLWIDPTDRAHIDESADIVARLVGFCERDGNIAKEMFELNFALPSSKKPWLLGWQPISNLLRL